MRSHLLIFLALTLSPMAHAEETKTVSWYKSHPITRTKVNELCMNSPGEAKHNANCINSEMASEHAALDRIVSQIDHPTVRCVPSSSLMLMADRCTPVNQTR
jgi:hypothetical protein